MVKLPPDEDTPEKRVKKIFRMMDKDENGSLDMEEFKEGSKRDQTIVSALSLYDGLVWSHDCWRRWDWDDIGGMHRRTPISGDLWSSILLFSRFYEDCDTWFWLWVVCWIGVDFGRSFFYWGVQPGVFLAWCRLPERPTIDRYNEGRQNEIKSFWSILKWVVCRSMWLRGNVLLAC